MNQLVEIARSVSTSSSRGSLEDYLNISSKIEAAIDDAVVKISKKDFDDSINILEEEYQYCSINLERDINLTSGILILAGFIPPATRHVQINDVSYLTYGLLAALILFVQFRFTRIFRQHSIYFYSLGGLKRLRSTLSFTE